MIFDNVKYCKPIYFCCNYDSIFLWNFSEIFSHLFFLNNLCLNGFLRHTDILDDISLYHFGKRHVLKGPKESSSCFRPGRNNELRFDTILWCFIPHCSYICSPPNQKQSLADHIIYLSKLIWQYLSHDHKNMYLYVYSAYRYREMKQILIIIINCNNTNIWTS